jgi:hypothetical protein
LAVFFVPFFAGFLSAIASISSVQLSASRGCDEVTRAIAQVCTAADRLRHRATSRRRCRGPPNRDSTLIRAAAMLRR